MTAATATRPGARSPRAQAIGTGHLHQALEQARDLAALHAFCSANVCTVGEVSSDGKRLDMLRVFDLMRTRGYAVSDPIKPQQQPKKGYTAWYVHVGTAGAQFDLGFYTPNTS